MRVLIIAPEVPTLPALLSADEIDAIAPNHDTDIIAGAVTQARIAVRSSGQHYDIIHFVAHGDESGIALTDGTMAPEDILQLARHTRVKLVFFNACKSTIPGQLLIDTGVPAAVVHNKAVLDKNALRLATYFYAELVTNGGDLRAAYYVTNPRDGSLSWLSNGNYRDYAAEAILAELQAVKDSAREREQVQRRLEMWLLRLAFVAGGNLLVSLAFVIYWITTRYL